MTVIESVGFILIVEEVDQHVGNTDESVNEVALTDERTSEL